MVYGIYNGEHRNVTEGCSNTGYFRKNIKAGIEEHD